MTADLLITHVHIATARDTVKGSVAVKDGKICAILAENQMIEAKEIVDGKGHYLIPGGVDPHVHIRYPGSAHRETFSTGTKAAAAGGSTTIIEHPISSPPQYSPEILLKRVEAAAPQAVVDYAFLGAAGGEFPEEIERIGKAGIVGYKTFLHAAPEGRDKEFQGLTSKNTFELQEAVRRIAKTGLLAAAHTEDNDLVAGTIANLRKEGKVHPTAHCLSRPPLAEVLAVQKLLALAKEEGARVYLVHISTPEAVALAKQAKAEGMEVYVETCPHYLHMNAGALEAHGAYAKCNPALREQELVDGLWEYVLDGTIDVIASDHAPYTVEEKEANPDDIFKAPAGFPGIETRIPFIMKDVQEGKITLNRAVALLCTNPARIYGLEGKGDIALGYDADLVLLDPYEATTLDHKNMFTMAKDICAFQDGLAVSGMPKMTWVRGTLVFDHGTVVGEEGHGQWLKKA